MALDLERYRPDEARAAGARTTETPRWAAIALFETGLALRRRSVILLIALAWLLAVIRASFFFTLVQGGLDASLVRAQGERLFTHELIGLVHLQVIPAVVLLAVAGAPTIARDLGTGAHAFLFSRDVGPGHYMAGKSASMFFLLWLVLWLPAAAFCGWALLGSGETDTITWQQVRPDITLGRLAMLAVHLSVVSGLLIALALAVSAYTPGARDAGLLFVAVFLGGWYVDFLIGRFPELSAFRYLSLGHTFAEVSRPIYGLAERGAGAAVLAAAVAGAAGAALAAVRRRLVAGTGMA